MKASAQPRKRGFTLIELLVVLSILATLLTIALPRYYRSVDHSKEVALKQTLLVVRDALDKFVADTGRYPESLTALVEKRYMRSLPFDPILDRNDRWILLPPPEADKSGVYDIRSGAPGNTLDGTPFREL